LQQEVGQAFDTPAVGRAASEQTGQAASTGLETGYAAPATHGALALAERPEADRIAEARVRGYEGENCSECGNFTLVRNGTCLKCDTCGSTSGCS
jgi:ribonucleoside-diphosphate reductase alpha chain